MTYEDIKKANEHLETIKLKGKEYVQVYERVKAFRSICPNGCISTDIVSLDNGVVTMKATITDDDGSIISTGYAQEKEENGYVNKTSFIENCETSAVGRALGFACFGIDSSMCSAEELVNALINQNKGDVPSPKMDRIPNGEPKASAEQVSKIKAECKRCGITQKFLMDSFPNAGGKIENLTNAQAIAVLNKFEKMPDKGA